MWNQSGEDIRADKEIGDADQAGVLIPAGARTTLAGDPDDVLARVRAFAKAGAEHMCGCFATDVEDFVPEMHAFAREVMPGL